jgi:truncated hemoglobin YjbI
MYSDGRDGAVADRPEGFAITPELADAVIQLGLLRRQMKELESQDLKLRECVLSQIVQWPRAVFPVKVGQFEVRLSDRRGRIDVDHAIDILTQARLMPEVPRVLCLRAADELEALGRALVSLAMPEETRSFLMRHFQAATDSCPDLSVELLSAFYERARLTKDQYRACFKDGQSVVPVLTVR